MGHLSVRLPVPHVRQNYFSLYLEPQLNLVRDGLDREGQEKEFGVNVGIQYQFKVNQWLSSYLLVGTGPHYISVRSERQAQGFIFSDNFGGGLQFLITRQQSLDVGYRFRHISNAGLEKPNRGINTNNWYIGYRWRFGNQREHR